MHTVTSADSGCNGELMDINRNDPLLIALRESPATAPHLFGGPVGSRLFGSPFVDNSGQTRAPNQNPDNTQTFTPGPTAAQDPNNGAGFNRNPGFNGNAGFIGNQGVNGNGPPDGTRPNDNGLGGTLFGGNTGPTFLGFPTPGTFGNPDGGVDRGIGDPRGLVAGLVTSLHLGGPSPFRSSSTSQAFGNGVGNGNSFGNSNGNTAPTVNQPGPGLNGNPGFNGNGQQGNSLQPFASGNNNGLIGGDDPGVFGGNTGPTFLGLPNPEGSTSSNQGGSGGLTATVSTPLLRNGPSASSSSSASGNGVGNGRGDSDGNGDISRPGEGTGDAPFDPSNRPPVFSGAAPQGSPEGRNDSSRGDRSTDDPLPDGPAAGEGPGLLGPGRSPSIGGSPGGTESDPSSTDHLRDDNPPFAAGHSDPGPPIVSEDPPFAAGHSDPGPPVVSEDPPSAPSAPSAGDHSDHPSSGGPQSGDSDPDHPHDDLRFDSHHSGHAHHEDGHLDENDPDHLRDGGPQFGKKDSGHPPDDGSQSRGDPNDHLFVSDSQSDRDHPPFDDGSHPTDGESNDHHIEDGPHFNAGDPSGPRFDHGTHFGGDPHDFLSEDSPRLGETHSHDGHHGSSPPDDHLLDGSRSRHPHHPFEDHSQLGNRPFDDPQSGSSHIDTVSPSDTEIPPHRPTHTRLENFHPENPGNNVPKDHAGGSVHHVHVHSEEFGPGPEIFPHHTHDDPTWSGVEHMPHSHVVYDPPHVHGPNCPCSCA